MGRIQRKNQRRGIYLVANRNSSDHCHNLIYTIRQFGCRLPIRIIPYGGEPILLQPLLDNVELINVEDFNSEGQAFVAELRRRMPSCSPGLLNRFLAWFGEFDEFLYSDNDIVALMNWEELFPHLADYELVNADREYTTKGKYNLFQPDRFEQLIGPGSLERAITAGHFLCRRMPQHTADLIAGVEWMESHPEVTKWHDQALLHVTLSLAKWPALNLCKPPYNWGSSWAGHYANTFDVLRTIQATKQPLSHLHYSGGVPSGAKPVDEWLLASLPERDRNLRLLWALARDLSGLRAAQHILHRARHKFKRTFF
ncbi:MAG: hypothetical protein ABR923_16710 [Terracidiphilus sp.]